MQVNIGDMEISEMTVYKSKTGKTYHVFDFDTDDVKILEEDSHYRRISRERLKIETAYIKDDRLYLEPFEGVEKVKAATRTG